MTRRPGQGRRGQSSSASGAVVGRLLYIGRLKPQKGVEDLIDAVALLAAEDVRLRIVGDGEAAYRRELTARVSARGLENRVAFVGAVSPDEVWSEYANADIFISPSRYEPFGIVLLEAMQAEVPVVATATDGAREIIEDGVSGRLVPVGSPAELARTIQTLVGDEEQRRRLVSGATRRLADFNQDRVFAMLERNYRELSGEVEQLPARF